MEDASDMPQVFYESESDNDASVEEVLMIMLVGETYKKLYTFGVLLFNAIMVSTYIKSSAVQMLEFYINCCERKINM